MKRKEEVLAAAKAALPKVDLEDYREAVNILREKGYTWREIADFLKERGIQVDHTRVYRTFGKASSQRQKETREVEIQKMTYVEDRKSKKKHTWNVLELELPSKLGQAITVIGYTGGVEGEQFRLSEEDTLSFRSANLVVKTGTGFPMAYIKVEIQLADEHWSSRDIYIMPKWEVLL